MELVMQHGSDDNKERAPGRDDKSKRNNRQRIEPQRAAKQHEADYHSGESGSVPADGATEEGGAPWKHDVTKELVTQPDKRDEGGAACG